MADTVILKALPHRAPELIKLLVDQWHVSSPPQYRPLAKPTGQQWTEVQYQWSGTTYTAAIGAIQSVIDFSGVGGAISIATEGAGAGRLSAFRLTIWASERGDRSSTPVFDAWISYWHIAQGLLFTLSDIDTIGEA